MKFLGKWFGEEALPYVHHANFGRYSDAYKSDEKYNQWDDALDCF